MVTALANAAAALAAALQGACGEPVTYCRGETSLAVTAWRSHVRGEADTDYGVEEYEVWDFIMPASALAALGNPQRGDRITDAGGEVFEVMPPAGTDKAFAWSDGAKTILRIHTKPVGVETEA